MEAMSDRSTHAEFAANWCLAEDANDYAPESDDSETE